ncbi:putative Glycosyltransferase SypP [Vibrio mimicus]|nr:putative Glycosyltransferase SypP [Vibrio mimicus]
MLYLSKNKCDNSLIKNIESKGIHVEQFKFKHIFLSGVFHSHGIKPDLLAFALKVFLKKKIMSTLHCNPHKEFSGRYEKIILPRIWLLMLKRFDKLIVLTNYIKNQIGLSTNAITIYNGIDLYMSSPKSKSIDNKIRDFKRNRKLIFTYGVLRNIKGFDFLIKSMSDLGDNYCLIIAGNGEDRENLNTIINNMDLDDRVLLIGHVEEPYKYMSEDDVCVFPSRSEGFPLSIIEAMLMGKKPLVTDIGPFVEIGNHADLFLFEKDNSESFKYVLHEMKTPNSFNNVEVAKSKFSASECFYNYKKIYDTLRGF